MKHSTRVAALPLRMAPSAWGMGALVIMGLSLLAAQPASAQVIRGSLVDGSTSGAIEGAMVHLFDQDDRIVAQRLTDGEGGFTLRAPAPGLYRVRADRIGHASTWSDVVRLDEGDGPVTLRLVAELAPVSLEAIQVAVDQQCRTRPSDRDLHRVWDEARKALERAAWTDEQQAHRYRIRTWTRRLDPDGRKVRSEQARLLRTWRAQTWASAPIRQLQTVGYASQDGDGVLYHGPDADVLLSDVFLDHHCFTLRRGSGESEGLLGLAFEPTRRPRTPDIRGVLWMEPATAHLKWIDFDFVALERVYPDIDDFPSAMRAGGRVEFRALPAGPWIVDRWVLRMPQLGVRWDRELRRAELLGIYEEGAEVLRVTDPRQATVFARGTTHMSGVVLGPDGDPVAGARVEVVGTPWVVRTDASGAFGLDEIAPGTYDVVTGSAALDSLGLEPDPVEVVVTAGQPANVSLTLRDIEHVLRGRCEGVAEPRMNPDQRSALVAGVVRNAEGRPAAGVTVRALWTWFRTEISGMRIQSVPVEVFDTTDDAGRYLLCGVLRDHPVNLVAESPEGSLEQDLFIPYRDAVVRLDLDLTGARDGSEPDPQSTVEGDTVVYLEGLDVEARRRQRRDERTLGVEDEFIDPERLDEVRDRTIDFLDLLDRELGPGVRITRTTSGGTGQGFCIQPSRRQPTLAGGSVGGCRSALLTLDGMPISNLPRVPASEVLKSMGLGEIESVRWIPPIDARLLYGDAGRNGVVEVTTRRGGR